MILMFKLALLTFKFLALSWITAKRQIIHDRTASRTTWDQSYDFIIVGAGTAGCPIGYRLTENPNVRVLLLEAGGAPNAIYSDIPGLIRDLLVRAPQLLWNYYSEPQLNVGKQFPEGRPPETLGRGIGGGSIVSELFYIRGNPRGYDEWEYKYGAVGWSFENVLPYFIRWENNTDLKIVENNPGYHGTTGPVQVSSSRFVPIIIRLAQKAYNELGFQNIDFNGANPGVGTMILQQFINCNGFRSSSSSAYIDPNPHPNNLHIVSKAMVTKILFNGLTAIGVEFAKNDISYRVYARREVIVTAGAENTPKLLMLSGVGIKSHLQRWGIPVLLDLPVGNNYQERMQVRLRSRINNTDYNYPKLNIGNLSELYLGKRGPLSEIPLLAHSFNTQKNSFSDWPNAQSFNVIPPQLQLNPIWQTTFELIRIRSRGTVRLQSTNPYVQPILDPAFLSDPADFEDAVDGVQFLFYFLERSSLAKYVTPPSFSEYGCPVCPNKPRYECIEGIKCYIRYNTVTKYHRSGTCRMGDVHREDVVVDPLLRVKYANHLRICDASIFPTLPNSPHAAALMLGEKCAEIIKDTYNL